MIDSPKRLRIKNVAVVGAGNMGSGIAQKVATEGFPVVLVDVNPEQVERGMQRLRSTLDEGVERRIFTSEQAAGILGRVDPSDDLAAARDADLVIEAVFEDPAVKKRVFERLDEVCKPETILATNTSSLYVKDLAAVTGRPQRFLGLHYFYHPAKNRLVEVVPGVSTAPEILDEAWRFQELIGKTPIRSADAPGFVVNRYFVPWLNEAVRLLDEGEELLVIEAAAREAFGVGMGPFQLMNVTGIPIALHAASTLGRELGAFYAPAPGLATQVEREQPWPLEETSKTTSDPSSSRRVADRLLGVTFLVAGQLVDEGVCVVEDADIGARVGLRWPRGPFELMNRTGIEKACALAAAVAERWKLEMPDALTRQRREARPFRFKLVGLEVQDGVATILINRPDAMNALNMEVLEQLDDRVDEALGRDDVRGIVLSGTGKAFVAGADIRFFVRHIEAGTIGEIRRLTELGQALLQKIDGSPKTVVARVHGLALGGGVELALACDYILASPRASLGFPETGIGIYPGLGGTQRTRQRVGVPLTKYLVLTGDILPAERAHRAGLVDRVVDPGELPATARSWALERPPVVDRQPPADTPPGFETEAMLFTAPGLEGIAGHDGGAGGDGQPARIARKVGSRAPLAVKLASGLIERGAGLPLDEGLALELASLEEIFSTEDALAGLRSVGGKKPVFKGR